MLGLGLSLVTQARGAGAPDNSPGLGDTLVFTLIGQSNMVGRAVFDGGSIHPAGVRQWGRVGADDGQLVPAGVPLQHHDPNPGQMGLDIGFAEAFAQTFPDASLVLVPSADGGTGFSANRWNPGDDLYADAVARTNAVLAANPGFVFAGFLWHQGESDVGFVGYQAALDAMIAALRIDTGQTGAPFVLGGLVPGWIAGNTDRQTIQAIIEGTPSRVSGTVFASSAGLTAAGADIHFVAPDLRMLGQRYFDAWVAARGLAPDAVGTIPEQTDTVSAAAPIAVGTIPDQADPVGTAAPVALGLIPDQEDILA